MISNLYCRWCIHWNGSLLSAEGLRCRKIWTSVTLTLTSFKGCFGFRLITRHHNQLFVEKQENPKTRRAQSRGRNPSKLPVLTLLTY